MKPKQPLKWSGGILSHNTITIGLSFNDNGTEAEYEEAEKEKCTMKYEYWKAILSRTSGFSVSVLIFVEGKIQRESFRKQLIDYQFNLFSS